MRKPKTPWKERNRDQQRLYQQQYYLDRKRERIEKEIAKLDKTDSKDDMARRLAMVRIKELRARLAQIVLQKRNLQGAA